MFYTHLLAITNGVLVPSDAILREAAEALPIAEQSGRRCRAGGWSQVTTQAFCCFAGRSVRTALELLALGP